jgi:4-hydroxybenzoate decarboxylase
VIVLPNLSIDVLDPASELDDISYKMIIDATTPVPPDTRGSFGEQLGNPPPTDVWRIKLAAMLKELRK